MKINKKRMFCWFVTGCVVAVCFKPIMCLYVSLWMLTSVVYLKLCMIVAKGGKNKDRYMPTMPRPVPKSRNKGEKTNPWYNIYKGNEK